MLLLYLIEGIIIAPFVAARFAATPDGKMPDDGGFWGRLGRMLGGPAMAKYVIRRVLAGVPVLLAIAFAGFVLIRAIPGGPFDYVGQKARSEQQVAALERQFGLDKPIPEQFIRYIGNIILRGDFGPSLGNNQRGQPVTEIISDGLPVSAQLGLLSVLIAFLFGIPIGVIAALNHNSPIDYTVSTFAIVGRSVPNMVLGPMFIIIFAVYLDVLPVAFWGTTTGVFWPPNDPNFDLGYYVSHAILPVLTLSSGSIAGIARLTRASVLQVLREDYIRTARAKGLPERIVIYLHALKNALIPIATVVGPFLAAAVTGSFITELIFAIPGMGDTFVQSVTNRDYNLLIGVIIIYSTFLIVGNIMVDITYTWLDPRIRLD
jgi:oligopeptide transport system permease protein